MQRKTHWPWLCLGLLYLLGCTPPPAPKQPQPSAPYALLTFSRSMRLLSLDDQQIDTLTHLNQLRVTPGQHTLRFMHLNAGVDGSAEHAGQIADPFPLDVHAGITYHFESKTWGIIWRPAVAVQTPIQGYCMTHKCDAVAAHILTQQLQTTDCQ